MKEEDVLKLLAAGTHLSGTSLDFQMEQCISPEEKRCYLHHNSEEAWEKLLPAAGAIADDENPAPGTSPPGALASPS